MTTVIGRAGASSRAGAEATDCHWTSAMARRSAIPFSLRLPRGRIGSRTRPAANRADGFGDQDLAAVRGVAQPAGDGHRTAVEVPVLGHRLAGVEPDPQAPCPPVARALHVDRAAHRRRDAGEGDHQAVAGRLHLVATVLGDRLAHRGEMLAANLVGAVIADAVQQLGGAHQVGEEDGDEGRVHVPDEHDRRPGAPRHPRE
jgi:hypothetical protein